MPRATNETHQSDWIMPPMAPHATTPPAVCALAATTTAVIVDLTTMWGTAAKAGLTPGNEDYNPNPIGHYLNVQADGGDIYIAFGADVASLAGISATAVSTVAANAITAVAGGTLKIPNGSTLPVKIPIGAPPAAAQYDNADVGKYSPARFLGFLTAAGTGTLRMWQSSP